MASNNEDNGITANGEGQIWTLLRGWDPRNLIYNRIQIGRLLISTVI